MAFNPSLLFLSIFIYLSTSLSTPASTSATIHTLYRFTLRFRYCVVHGETGIQHPSCLYIPRSVERSPIFCLQGLCRANQHLAFACLCDHVPTLNVDDSAIGLSVRPIFTEARLEYLCLRSPIIICYPFRLSFPNLLSDGTFTEVRLLGGHSL